MEQNIDLNDTRTAFEYKSDKDLKRTLFIFKLIQKPAIVKVLTKMADLIEKDSLLLTKPNLQCVLNLRH